MKNLELIAGVILIILGILVLMPKTKKMWAILLAPIFYIRCASLLFIPFGLIIIYKEGFSSDVVFGVFFLWGMWTAFYGFIIGNLDGLIPLTDWAIKKFNIKYKYVGSWNSDSLSMRSGWGYPTIEVNGVKHNWTVIRSGGNMHDYETSIKRNVIFTYLWGPAFLN
jgi:hypothetical protein